MYNLLVTAEDSAWDKPNYVYDLTRYLEYMDDKLRARLKLLDESVRNELMKLPALFAYETPVGAPARVGRITAIHNNTREVRVSFTLDRQVARDAAALHSSTKMTLRQKDRLEADIRRRAAGDGQA